MLVCSKTRKLKIIPPAPPKPEILAAKVEVMDNFMFVLHTAPAERNQAVSVDVAWQLGQCAETMERETARSA